MPSQVCAKSLTDSRRRAGSADSPRRHSAGAAIPQIPSQFAIRQFDRYSRHGRALQDQQIRNHIQSIVFEIIPGSE